MDEKVIVNEMNEEDVLSGLLEAADGRRDTVRTVEIIRNGKVLFRFRIRPLGADEYNQCRKNHTKYVRNKALGGILMPEDTDTLRYNSEIIYTATVEEDRAKIWGNKTAWDRLGVLSALDLIEKVLFAGEKDKIIELVDKISGFDSSMEEVAKK